MKTVETLVQDIYDLMATRSLTVATEDAEEAIETFGEALKDIMRKEFLEFREDKRTLRLSNVGKGKRFLWNLVNGKPKEDIQPHTYIKFLYGHIIEEMLLCLVKLAGHTVTNEQKRCNVAGIIGSMDCSIDGVLTDVKSASSFGFKKFKDGSLIDDDPFGYIGQIKAYAKAENQKQYGWLAMDKGNGHLTYLKYNEEDKPELQWDIEKHIEELKIAVELDEPPELCDEPIPDGKSGNMKLPTLCSYCQYKKVCYPDLRTFLYSSGPRFLTKVVNEPKVQEINNNGSF